MKNILITGGAGYIGSHTAVVMLSLGYDVTIVDNLSNSREDVIKRIEKITGKKPVFHKTDVTDEKVMKEIFEKHNFHGIMHFAGFKAVGESWEKPLDYYYNNVLTTMVLMKLALSYQVNNFIFSSSATVYGDNILPFREDMELLPTTNPYGETKVISERILIDTAKANPQLALGILRYFNPVGAHEGGLIGEMPSGIPNNLMPYIVQVAKRKLEKLKVYGDDYPTIDGSGVRDYIHVMDLAEGHGAAYENLKTGINIYNLGTGSGTSVFQIIKAFEETNNLTIPYEVVDRRSGDIAESYADVSKARRDLMWSAKRDIKDMCKDAWNYERKR